MLDLRKFLAVRKNRDLAVKPVDMHGIGAFFLFFQCADLWQGIIIHVMNFIVGTMRIGNDQQIELPFRLDAAAAVDGNDVFVTAENRIKLLNTVIVKCCGPMTADHAERKRKRCGIGKTVVLGQRINVAFGIV